MKKSFEVTDVEGRIHCINVNYVIQIISSVNDLVIQLAFDKTIRVKMDYNELKTLIYNASV